MSIDSLIARFTIRLDDQVHVDKVIDHVVRTLSPMAKRGVVLEKALASEKIPPIVADERRIIQLLSNLIGNALKFTDKVPLE